MPKFREVSGQFVGYVPDGPDTNIVPDRAPMDGQVVFTPVFTGGVIAFPELVPPEFAHPKPIRAKIIDGFVRVEVAVGDDVLVQPLSLMVTVDDEASQVWSWRAEFTNMRIGTGEVEVTIPAWSFRVPDGTGPVDLTELVPLKTSATVDVTKGPRGAGLQNITAVDGQLVFEYTDGQEATIPVPEAVQGPQGEPGPAGADGEQGPEGPQGPAGEIPDLLVGNITDATPTGKNLMLAATEGAARNALGLQAGATAANGSAEELNTGTSNTPRAWTASNIANYVTGAIQPVENDVHQRLPGIVSTGVPGNDLSLISETGFYQTDSSTQNRPDAVSYMSVIHISAEGGSQWQMAVPSRSNAGGRQKIYTRLGSTAGWSPWERFLSSADVSASIVPQITGGITDTASDLYAAVSSTAGHAAASSKIFIPANQFAGVNGATTAVIDSTGLSSKALTLTLGASGTALHQTWVSVPDAWAQADIYFLWTHTESTLMSGGVTFRCSTALPQAGQSWGSSVGTVNTTSTVSGMQSYVIQESKVAASIAVSSDQPLFLHVGRSGTAAEDTFGSVVNLLGVKIVRKI